MRLFLEPNCTNALQWGYEIAEECDLTEIGTALLERGYSDHTQHDWLRIFLHPRLHRIVFLPKTGRIQIRIDYLTPPSERSLAAIQIARDLSDAIASLPR